MPRWALEVLGAVLCLLILLSQFERVARWRGLVRQHEVDRQLMEKDREIHERDQTMEQLRTRLVSQEDAVVAAQRTSERLRAQRPSLPQVMARMKGKAVTDDDVVAEARRVLGVPVRIAQHCE